MVRPAGAERDDLVDVQARPSAPWRHHSQDRAEQVETQAPRHLAPRSCSGRHRTPSRAMDRSATCVDVSQQSPTNLLPAWPHSGAAAGSRRTGLNRKWPGGSSMNGRPPMGPARGCDTCQRQRVTYPLARNGQSWSASVGGSYLVTLRTLAVSSPVRLELLTVPADRVSHDS